MKDRPNINPTCCEKQIVEWINRADQISGPEHPGWVIGFDSAIYGDTSFVNVAYCPLCGAKLPEKPE